ncbi:NmrA family NAD(P)-binding protein [Agromyces mediolanus]|uniref:NmrA family NAD(P)-binding protein n=1 Tax=Agromyces mediolanus TaxID=41986 RepID=UPI00203E3E8C|nr:NmrA family NAD(P)-binding protein [Agromyces mediolanus]MCM3658455.1 NmrA family NAD(P)-binding protein [Agromyces mediolanus]
MTYLVHGATGAQGSPVLAALTVAGKDAVAAVRNPAGLPAGTRSLAVDLADAEALARAYSGAEGVFVHLPMGGDPAVSAAQAAAIVSAVDTARPARVVISTSGAIVDEPGSPLQAPSTAPIQQLIQGVTATGVSTAVVAPRLYLENLLLPVVAEPARSEGVLRYPLPAEYPVSWSSHLDVADAVVELLTDHRGVEGIVAIGHSPGLTGTDLAAGFAQHLATDVRYEAISPDAFGELITPLFGAAAQPVVDLYRALNGADRNVVAEDRSAQTLLGLAPRSVADWLAVVDA